MLHLFTYLKKFNELRSLCDIDLSTIPTSQLAEEADKICQHHKDKSIFLGYLEPWILDGKHEVRLRYLIRKFPVYLVCFHPESLPFSWKNEIDTVYLEESKKDTSYQDGHSKTINNGSIV